jgi:hypothetical protein
MTDHTGSAHPEDDGYSGQATLVVAGQEFRVTVQLRGHFQPIDGFYRWYGRIAPDQALAEVVQGRKTQATLRTPGGESPAELSDPDPWGRYRVTGSSTPPFVVQTTLHKNEI